MAERSTRTGRLIRAVHGDGCSGPLLTRTVRSFAVYFLCLCLVSGVVVFTVYLVDRAAEKRIFFENEKGVVKVEKDELDRDFIDVVSDLRTLSMGHEVYYFLDNPAFGRDIIVDLSAFCLNKPYCDKVRIIDDSGKERLRLDERDGAIVITPEKGPSPG